MLLANDLVGFAELLALNDVKLYEADWCHNCAEQRELFEDGAQFLPEVGLFNADGTRNQIRPDIQNIPTWEFPDGSGGTKQVTGKLTLDQIAAESGIDIPQSDDPWVKPIGELVQVLSGSPLHVPLDGYDPNGDPLTYTATVADANGNPTSLLTAEVLEGNRSMRVNVVSKAGGRTMDMGQLVFELFEQRAPRPTGRLVQLTTSGQYDDSYYHRLEPGFVLQGGGATPTQGGASGLGTFDDQFHVDLQHNRDGVLSYAKAGDDTNDFQYFVTLGPARYLDFNHSVAGQLVEGFELLRDVQAEPVIEVDPDNDPNTDNSFHSPEYPKQVGVLPAFDGIKEPTEIFTDTENAVVMLKAAAEADGQEFTVTITAKDPANNETSISFDVAVAADLPENGGANGGPFLEDIGEVVTAPSTPAQIQLSAVDVEGDPVFFDAVAIPNVTPDNTQIDVNNETGLVTVTPPDGFVGQLQVLVAVRALNGSNTADTWDRQAVPIDVVLGAPTIDLLPGSDSNIPNDNITNVPDMVIRVSGAAPGAAVDILDGDTVVGQGQANSDVDIKTNALDDGVHRLTARQTLGGVQSERSSELQVLVDTVAPAAFTSTPPTTATVGIPLVYDAENPEEGTVVYSLVDAPAGVSIHANTGVVTWTPEQSGAYSFQVKATDLAGNARTQDINLQVVEPTVRVRLETTDLLGTPIERIKVGGDYLLRAYVKDARWPPLADGGVFSSYVNIQYDSSLVSTNASGPGDITFADEYTWLQTGDFSTPGQITVVGSAAAPDFDSPGLFPRFGPQEKLQFSILMTAANEGEAEFSATPSADELHPIAVYGSPGAVPPENVLIQGTTLVIGDGLVARDDIFNVDEDSLNNTFDVINNPGGKDENPEGGTITITSVGAASNGGNVSIVDGKRLKYEPARDFFGVDKFTYTIGNGQSTSTATVTVQVAPQNDDPDAVDDSATVEQDSRDNPLFVLGNDKITPDEGETLRVIGVVNPNQGGKVTIAPGGTHLIYTPSTGFVGKETINYTIGDGNGGTANATVTVTVEEGSKPTAVDDKATVDEDSTGNVIDVLANDSPAEGGQLRVIDVTQPLDGGTVTIASGQASVLYTPKGNFFGTTTFTYTVSETDGGQAVATVTVTVNGTNDPPTANDDEVSVTKNSQNNLLKVLDNDSISPDTQENLKITQVSLVSPDIGSTLAIAGDGKSVVYTPLGDFTGSETFTYTINDRDDGSGLADQATVTVNVADSMVTGYVKMSGTDHPIRAHSLSYRPADGQGAPAGDSAPTDAEGHFWFAATPGMWTVEAAPVFLTTVDREVNVASGGDASAGVLHVARVASSFGIADFSVMAPGQSSMSPHNAILAAVTPGSTPGAGEGEHNSTQHVGQQHWYSVEAGWENYDDVVLELSENLSQITITGTPGDGHQYRATISATDPRLAKILDREGDARLIRVTVDPASLDWQHVDEHAGGECTDQSDACSIDGEGEAEEAVAIPAAPQALAEATTPIDASPAIVEQFAAPPVADTAAEGEAAVAVPVAPVTAVVSSPAPLVPVFTPVPSASEAAKVPIHDAVVVETVAETPESPDSPAFPFPGVVIVDTSVDSAFVQNGHRDSAVDEPTTTDAVDAVLADPALEEERVERDLVLIGSEAEADEFALAVDWLLSDGLE